MLMSKFCSYEVRQRSITPARISARVPDVAQHAPTLPVPTITTPTGLPSPSHAAPSPGPAPVRESDPRYFRAHSRAQSRAEQQRMEPVDRAPTPIHQAPLSPSHPPYEVLPDNYIPYANASGDITMPPPHELSRPVTPTTPNPSLPETILPVAPPSQETLVPAPSVRSRDFAYGHRTNPSFLDSIRHRGPPGTMSPQSRTSTRISEFDILGPARARAGGAKSIQSTLYSYEPGQSSSTLSLPGRAPARTRTPGPSGIEVSTPHQCELYCPLTVVVYHESVLHRRVDHAVTVILLYLLALQTFARIWKEGEEQARTIEALLSSSSKSDSGAVLRPLRLVVEARVGLFRTSP